MRWMTVWNCVACAIAMCASATADEIKPLSFAGEVETLDIKQVHTNGAFVSRVSSEGRKSWRVATGHQTDWPGISIRAPHEHWDLSPFAEVRIAVKNIGSNALPICSRIDNPGADGKSHCVNGTLTLAPGQSGTLVAVMDRKSENAVFGKLFGMVGYPGKWGRAGTIDASNVTQIIVFIAKPSEDHLFEIASIEAAGSYVAPVVWTGDADSFFPFVDAFGQYKHSDWPGKTKSVADLAAAREAEERELKAKSGPDNWDRYGGWAAGPALEATGFFRTQKINGKWWLVDPSGHLFFSNGIDTIGYGDMTPIEERTNWFEKFPGDDKEFPHFLEHQRCLLGHYAGRSPLCFSFVKANLQRKYGPDCPLRYPELVHRRLRSWGINTIGNWADPSIKAVRLTPYVDSIGSWGAKMIEGSGGYWGKFPDVFDPSFPQALQHSMRGTLKTSAGDEWCIGYFSDNEMSWGDDTSLALAALASGADQEAKKVFIADLKAKYGDIAKLNAAWGATLDSWDAMLQGAAKPDPARARVDLTAFYTKAAEQYFRAARDAIKEAAPHQLYLGCRFAAGNPLASAAAAKYCDVVSFNVYKRSVADFVFDGGADVPLLIGEFHFGALDRGLFSPGLVELPSQQERANAYREYVQGALRHPQIVGCHWFEYQDEPLTGRAWDGENYQIGFVDVADTPYPEIVAACRDAGCHLYK